jgi:hypothetical protein
MTTNEAPPVTHYLLTMTTAGEPVRGDQLSVALRDCFEALGVQPLAAVSYTTSLHVNPKDVGIKDTWMTTSEEDRNIIRARAPHLVTAIELLCGIRREDYV